MSDTVTDDVRVRVRPAYHADRSSPERSYWFFSYTIEIANEGHEIAVTLGVKLPTVYSRLRLAKAQLERSVQRDLPSEKP